jgi:ubiquinone/menaquinone biosynthesis C-methylase UbiE
MADISKRGSIGMATIKTSGVDAVRDMYDVEAESYSTMMDSEIEHPLYSDTLGRLQKRIANLPGVIIDAPCGSGHMLAMYHESYDQERALKGIDLSPRMVAIAAKRLGPAAEIMLGDIRKLDAVPSDSAAAVISHFALHHLDVDGVLEALLEWHRVLRVGGYLVIGAWEGTGVLDYGDTTDIVAIRHGADELESMMRQSGFEISRNVVELDDEMMMNAVYIEGTKG